ncbi:SulP family inorganic anion transporter [Catalinimonas niigatensis]|uniref:SulP family inorganic anion transporter n=1 Tax=Catalinimonas niigatensis TaxID=1397264 RepID=UPI002665ED06|nr:SulP family inorganic anion transporter [Catalinimonas niigatensis]WPP51421.1 SulP family inorganic anion transporter [Catalinimonas niigatensis]
MSVRPNNFLKNLKYDLPSGLVVFLVALPLCLGIALASGAPLLSGLVSGIVGGLVVSMLSGSQLAVSGPAAGLTVIVLDGISEVGSFEVFLCAVILAGIIQLALGFLKAGVIGYYFPSSVIKGMLAAIGLILILKQIPHFLGIDQDFFGDIDFLQADGRNTFSEIIYAFENFGIGPLVIGMVSLGIIILWKQAFIKQSPILSVIPSALVVVIVGVILNQWFVSGIPALAISGDHLVQLPFISSFNDIQNELALPDFSQIMNVNVFRVAITIAIIASLETLLSIEAIDKLDPQKRRTPMNRELKAQGVGNIVAGLLGGLPMTAVIVRGTANITAGGKTKMSSFYHGLLLISSVLLIPGILNLIPLSALAAILLDVGYKLSKPALYKAQWKLGRMQFIPFLVTIVAILFTDLLIGISIGMIVGVYFILRANYKTPFLFNKEDKETHHHYTIHLSEHVSFLNKAHIASMLEDMPENAIVDIYGNNTRYLDYDVIEAIYEFREQAKHKNIKFSLINLPTEPGLDIEQKK